MDKASTDGSFTIAQTNGIDRRQDRRGDRQDCRAPRRGTVSLAGSLPPERWSCGGFGADAIRDHDVAG